MSHQAHALKLSLTARAVLQQHVGRAAVLKARWPRKGYVLSYQICQKLNVSTVCSLSFWLIEITCADADIIIRNFGRDWSSFKKSVVQ